MLMTEAVAGVRNEKSTSPHPQLELFLHPKPSRLPKSKPLTLQERVGLIATIQEAVAALLVE